MYRYPVRTVRSFFFYNNVSYAGTLISFRERNWLFGLSEHVNCWGGEAKRKELLQLLIVYYAHTRAWKQQMSSG